MKIGGLPRTNAGGSTILNGGENAPGRERSLRSGAGALFVMLSPLAVPRFNVNGQLRDN
jgi:hypothetical protein